MIGPRVRARVGLRCDEDECCERSPWSHPLFVAVATVAAQVVGEVIAKRLTAEPEEKPKGRAR